MNNLFFLKMLFSLLFTNMDMMKVLFKLAGGCFCNGIYDALKYSIPPLIGLLAAKKRRRRITHSQTHTRSQTAHPRRRKKLTRHHSGSVSISVSEESEVTTLTNSGKSVFILKTKNKTVILIVP